MSKLLANPRFLAVYSGILTLAFVLTVGLDLARGWPGLPRVSSAEQHDAAHGDFDQLTVHRINIVEPDGTPSFVLSDKAEFPGGFFKGKELVRPDRKESGMLFMNNEGTENGGMLFGGYQSSDGKRHSFGHLSFDEYEQDQTVSIDSSQDGETRDTAYQISDNSDTLMTPEVLAEFSAAHAMAQGPARQKALAAVFAKYPVKQHRRAALEREPDRSAVLRLQDPEGRTRILLRVAADGTPTMQFLNADGKVMQQWPEAGSPVQR